MQVTNTVLEDIAAEIGFGATVRLAAVYGGTTIRVPGKCADGHPLVKLLGHTCVARLAEMFPSPETLDVPKLVEFDRWRKVKAASSMAARGIRKSEIADMLVISQKHVGNLLKMSAESGVFVALKTSGESSSPIQASLDIDTKPDTPTKRRGDASPARGDPGAPQDIRVVGPAGNR